MAGNSGGPWGGDGRGPGGNGGGNGDDRRPGRRPSQDRPQIPEIEQIVKKGQEQLRVLMGGRGGHRGGGSSGNGGGDGPRLTRSTAIGGVLVAMVVYFFASFYTVQPDEEGVELLLGKYYRTTQDGPH